ncbi:MAG: ATP-dependent DNA helicase RecQ [Bacteroidota bacterium]
MPTPLNILQEYWGYPAFRPQQEDIIESVLAGRDTMALLPTGGGKSICFQVPGMVLPGLTIVISPLIALMRDQVAHLNSRHIPAAYINSSLRRRDIDRKLQNAMDGRYKFLYLAPERLATDMFRARLPQMEVSLLAVDEAHCISQWGYDFRPAYLKIGELRETLPQVPAIALTATAPPRVQEDIQDKLELRDPAIFRKSFRRDNLSYRVISSERVPDRILQFLQDTPGSGIIYARTRKRTQALADLLQRHGESAAAYHGGMSATDRNHVQQQWIANKIRVITATNAFGMGIDKPDVRFVLHYNLPSDLESYYQEAGRAGRDGKAASAVAFDHPQDLHELERWVEEKYPSWEVFRKHYEIIANAYRLANTGVPERSFPFDPAEVGKRFQVHPLKLYNSVRIMDQRGLLSLQDGPDDYGYVRVAVRPADVLAYKDRFPDHAPLIDFLLRSLGGEVYREWMRFSPVVWARQLEWEVEVLERRLKQLAAREIIRYKAPRGEPTVRFLRPRQRLHPQLLNWSQYEFLGRQGKFRLEMLRRYAETPARMCRSRMLEKYFGEERADECGICDHCREKAAGKLTVGRIAEIRSAILRGVQADPAEIRDLLAGIEVGTARQRLEVLRDMLDRGELEKVGGLQVREGKNAPRN